MKKTIEKLIYSLLITTLLITNMSYGEREYFNYLSDDSLIKQKCEQAGEKGLFFKNKTQKACDYIHEVLRAMAEDEEKTINGNGPFGWMNEVLTLSGNTKRMKDAIRIILEKEPDETKWNELEKVSNAASSVKKDRVEREKLQKQKETAQKEYEKKHPKF